MKSFFLKQRDRNKRFDKANFKIALLTLFVVHFFGVLGIIYLTSRPYFQSATPLNLILTAILLFYFHKDWNKPFFIFLIATVLIGYFVEVLGVATQSIFGAYTYGNTLGPKLINVPPIIGLNWLILTYSFGVMTNYLTGSAILSSVLGSIFMVALDFLIEPVAINLDFWSWANDMIPLQNYIAWFITAFVLQLLFHFSNFNKTNSIAIYVIFVEITFFIILQILI